jgi:hypothetical protein
VRRKSEFEFDPNKETKIFSYSLQKYIEDYKEYLSKKEKEPSKEDSENEINEKQNISNKTKKESN